MNIKKGSSWITNQPQTDTIKERLSEQKMSTALAIVNRDRQRQRQQKKNERREKESSRTEDKPGGRQNLGLARIHTLAFIPARSASSRLGGLVLRVLSRGLVKEVLWVNDSGTSSFSFACFLLLDSLGRVI